MQEAAEKIKRDEEAAAAEAAKKATIAAPKELVEVKANIDAG